MSVCTNIHHFDPVEAGAETVEWFRGMGISVPALAGRAPRLEEVLEALRSFAGVPIECDLPTPPDGFLCIIFGDAGESNDRVQLEGMLEEDGTLSLWFRGGDNWWTKLAIVKRLSRRCGPQLLWTDVGHADDFSIVTPEMEIEAECKRRCKRWNAAYPAGPRVRVIRPPPPIADA